jgi:hypothetical protein
MAHPTTEWRRRSGRSKPSDRGAGRKTADKASQHRNLRILRYCACLIEEVDVFADYKSIRVEINQRLLSRPEVRRIYAELKSLTFPAQMIAVAVCSELKLGPRERGPGYLVIKCAPLITHTEYEKRRALSEKRLIEKLRKKDPNISDKKWRELLADAHTAWIHTYLQDDPPSDAVRPPRDRGADEDDGEDRDLLNLGKPSTGVKSRHVENVRSEPSGSTVCVSKVFCWGPVNRGVPFQASIKRQMASYWRQHPRFKDCKTAVQALRMERQRQCSPAACFP